MKALFQSGRCRMSIPPHRRFIFSLSDAGPVSFFLLHPMREDVPSRNKISPMLSNHFPSNMLFRTFIAAFAVVLTMGGIARAQESLGDLLGAPGFSLADPHQRAQAVERVQTIKNQRRLAAGARARQMGLPLRVINANGSVRELMDFDGDTPVYFTTHNVNAAISSGASPLQVAPFLLTGAGVTVGIWDGGGVRSTHQEFGGRSTIMDGGSLLDHSTHVAGTIGAAGVVSSAKGMATSVTINSYEWTNDKTEMTSRAASFPGEAGKIYLSNHSYGYIVGWYYTGLSSPMWTWYGLGTTDTGYEDDFGRYDTDSRDDDALAYSAPYYLMFRSAGNDRADNPSNGQSVSLTTGTSPTVAYNSSIHPAGDGTYRNGYDSISFDATAKNVITIGSVGDAVSGGSRAVTNAYMSSYSAWGPTDDGRIKPDVVANGENLYSSFSTSDAAYGTYSGTSMATPNAAGSAALLIQYFSQQFTGQVMRASTLKALLIHTADDRGNAGPDYQFGWGLINVKAAADLIKAYHDAPGSMRMTESQITPATAQRTHSFTWDGVSPIRATLVWTDPSGAPATASDQRTARLVNNLDLKITGPTGTMYQPYRMPFVGDWTSATWTSPAIAGKNDTDNAEQVYVAAPGNPGVYFATVSVDGTLTNGLQKYSLLISGSTAAAALAPGLSGVTPNAGSSGSITLNLTGTQLMLGATVKLTRAGQSDVMATGIESLDDSIKCRADLTGMASGLWNVMVTNPDGQNATLTNSFTIIGPIWASDLESGTTGWSNSATVGNSAWALTTAKSQSPIYSYFASGPASKNLDDLYSPTISIPAGATNLQFIFWHTYELQNNRDGGVLELSVDDGAWFDTTTNGSGAVFAGGGYTGTLGGSGSASNRNPLYGRKAWTGTLGTWSQVTINLTNTAMYAGHTLRARWRLGTNSSTSSAGWYVDSFSLTGNGVTPNSAPVISAIHAVPVTVTDTFTDLDVTATDDAAESELTYTWTCIGGTFQTPVSFSLNGTHAAKNTRATFTGTGFYSFSVTVTDAQGLTTANSVDVTVDPMAVSLTVEPVTSSIVYGSTQSFTPTQFDQFGAAMPVQPAFAWSTTGGSIDSNGLFTATAAGGPYTITASAGSTTGQAGITVTKATAAIVLSNLTQTYTGSPLSVTALTAPAGLSTAITYNGSGIAPTDFGSYAVAASITHSNYQGSASGTLLIQGQPLSEWQSAQFTPEQRAAGLDAVDADPDHDDWLNLAEYALGTLPNESSPRLLATMDADGFAILFTRPKGLPDVTYFAESSDDLILWNPLTIQVLIDAPTQTLRALDPLTTGDTSRRFLRLKFTMP